LSYSIPISGAPFSYIIVLFLIPQLVLSQTCPESIIDYKSNGSGKYCIEFSDDPGTSSVTYLGTTLNRQGGTNLYTNNFNCNGNQSTPSEVVVTIGSITCTYTNGALPIELLEFLGREISDGFMLYWTTASEINNEYFSIGRSNDGINFTEIGRVTGAGHSVTPIDYSFLDPNPAPGINYYRITQYDFDGGYSRSVLISYTNENSTELEFYQSGNMLNLEVNTQIEEMIVSTVDGIITFHHHGNLNDKALDISNWPKGIFVISYKLVNSKFKSKKIILL